MRAQRALAENDSGWNLKGCYCHFPPTRVRIGGTGKLEVLETLGRIYVSRPVAKTLVLDWKSWLAQLFLDVFVTLCGVNPYWTQKSFKIKNFYIIDWIKKKLLVDVANLATCWTNDYDILLEVLGTLGRIYVSRPVAKTLVLDWKSWLAQLFLDVFVTLCGVNLYWTQKSFKISNFT